MLLRFPVEVLRYIIKQVEDRRDLKSLCEVSKELYIHAAETLYKEHDVIIKLDGCINRNLLGLAVALPLLAVSQRPSNPLQHVQALRVTSEFAHNIRDRCWHNATNLSHPNDGVSDDEEYDIHASRSGGDDDFTTCNLPPLLEPLMEGRLRSFNWDLSACIPMRVLGADGYLPHYQKNIEHLSLLMDGHCSQNIDGSSPLFLKNFQHIKRVSWTGLASLSDFKSLVLAVRVNAKHLTGLYLDFETMEYDSDWVAGLGFRYNLIADELLSLPVEVTLPRCPALEQLSLCAFSLTSIANNLTSAINFDSLRILRLRKCRSWEVFLTCLTRSGKAINLKRLEIQAMPGDVIDETTIGNFLATFSGLEVLHLSLPGPPAQSLPVLEAIRHHVSTLRQFVYHLTENGLPLASDLHYFEGEMWINPEDFERLYDHPSGNPLSRLNIECLGLACEPELLRLGQPVLLPSSGTRSLKIIHVRQSGPHISRFNSWGKQIFKDSRDLAEFTNYVVEMDDDLPVSEMNGKSRKWFILHDWEDGSSPGEGGFDVTPLCPEFRELADWVFGPHGIPSLRILAFGDFSCRDRFMGDNFLLCRIDGPVWGDQLPYRHFNPRMEENRSLEKLLGEHDKFFQACPDDVLMT